MKPQKSATEIALVDFIMKLVQNIPTGALYLSQSFEVVVLSYVVIYFELLGYWICVVFEVFICN